MLSNLKNLTCMDWRLTEPNLTMEQTELYFGESLMIDLKRKQDLLTPGTHKLKN